jgi:16S rRNA C967 or C1407 C5-methylase (RsmB/RsmF family)
VSRVDETGNRSMMLLPDRFQSEMTELFCRFGLDDQLPAFMDSFFQKPTAALRANTLKIDPKRVRQILADMAGSETREIKPVSWTSDGFYIPGDVQPGKWAAHAAGLYYIQEPSAMFPVQVLDAKPGERVLDLCAAPGGKSAQIAAQIGETGLLWANDISSDRLRVLVRNLELMGCIQSVVTRSDPGRLARTLPGWFDAILADVPCSGASLFRRDRSAVCSWQAYGPRSCAMVQDEILEAAWTLLRPGGRLVYATCTFSLEENEGRIAAFHSRHEDCRIVPVEKPRGVDNGLPVQPGLEQTARIWPHRAAAEGHFCACLKKAGAGHPSQHAAWQIESVPADTRTAFHEFCHETLNEQGNQRIENWINRGYLRLENNRIHVMPPCPDGIKNIPKVKTGLFLGQVYHHRKTGWRFKPSSAFALALKADDFRYAISGKKDSDLIRRYLRGETLASSALRSAWPTGAYGVVALVEQGQSWPVGWIRSVTQSAIKNLYPAGWTRPVEW